jgi:hypothetical protein
VSQVELPVASVEFLRRVHPSKNLLNAYPFGGYVVQMLRDLPVSLDGREHPFEAFRDEMRRAEQSPAAYAAFLREHDINTVLTTIPKTAYDPRFGFVDGRERLLPSSEWAEVFFDDVSVVYLRRTPDHASVIAEHEHRFLRRGLPAGFGATGTNLPAEVRAAFEAEIDRCLREVPDNTYCLVCKAAYAQARQELDGALSLLEHAERINPRSPETLVTLAGLYKQLGDTRGEARARARFNHLTMP